MQVKRIPWTESREWQFDGSYLHHESGGYFRVIGARRGDDLEQPLIDQPEIGILGFLIRQTNGTTEICLQAKPEPGNVGLVQIAPSVQATESNYTQLHCGRPTPLLTHFSDPVAGSIRSNTLQSEQGTRFFKKRNRNMVVEYAQGTQLSPEQLRWFPVADILKLMLQDFMVNTDARSVLATCPWDLLVRHPFERWQSSNHFGTLLGSSFNSPGFVSDQEMLDMLTETADTHSIEVIGLQELSEWTLSSEGVRRTDSSGFHVTHVDISTTQREVDHWDQPLIALDNPGKVVLFCRLQNEILEFGFLPRNEIGFGARTEYGPSVQDHEHTPASTKLLSCKHSDEGGRFYRCISTYEIRMLDSLSEESVELEQKLSWMTLGQISRLIKMEGVFTNEARSLVSMLLAYL